MNLVIVGAGGFGRELLQYAIDASRSMQELSVKGFLDDDVRKAVKSVNQLGARIVGNTTDYRIDFCDRLLISIGDPATRRSIFERLHQRGAKYFTLVHPTAYVAPTAHLEQGCIVAPFAFVGSFAHIECNALLNLYAVAGHDVRIGAHSVLSPHAVVNGGSIVGQQVFIGTHAVTAPGVRIGGGCKVSAGAVLYREAPEQSLVTGNPAKSYRLDGHLTSAGQVN